MSLDNLEERAAAAMDFASSVAGPLNAAERDTFRYLLVASKCATVKKAVAKLNPSARESHVKMIARLCNLINPDPFFVLAHLEKETLAFLAYARALGRPLLKSECRAWAWMLEEWTSRTVAVALENVPAERAEVCRKMFYRLAKLIEPDPVERVRLQRNRPALEADLHDGNFALNTPPFYGVSPRRMSAREAKERVALLARLCHDIGVIAAELSLVRNEDRPDAARMVKLGKLMMKRGRAFAERCKAQPDIPPERSTEEVMHDMQTMNELMAVEPPP